MEKSKFTEEQIAFALRQAACCAELFAAVFAVIAAVVLRKADVVAQFGHATGESRHSGCGWVSIWN